MKKLYLLIVFSGLFQIVISQVVMPDDPIDPQEIFILNQPLDGNTTYDYIASKYITLEDGFEYDPEAGEYFLGEIDPYLVFPPEGGVTGGPNPEDNGVVGTLPGSFSVSPTGAATYSIPIDLPPGINGMTPTLGLIYNSLNNQRNILGVGWSIAGFSSISRTNCTQYYNGMNDNIDFDNDQLQIDGNYLIMIADDGEKTVYKTENDKNIAKVTYYKDSNPYPYFDVIYKNGITKIYGNTDNSRQIYSINGKEDAPVLIWHISRIEDLYGNYIDFEYLRFINTGELHPERITYTGHKTDSKNENINYTVNFEYTPFIESDIDRIEKKIYENLGSSEEYITTNSYNLNSFTININNEEISKYTFEYEDNTNLITRDVFLKRITYMVPSVSKGYTHYNSTYFDWHFYNPVFNLDNFSGGDDLTNDKQASIGSIDINGDGKSELLEFKRIKYGNIDYNMFEIYTPDVAGDNITITDIPTSKFLKDDYDNDGDEELIVYNDDGFKIYNFVLVNNSYNVEISYEYTNHNGVMFNGDFNGDGLPDLLMQYNVDAGNKSGSKKLAFFFLLTDNSSGDLFSIEDNIDLPQYGGYSCYQISDFNGDGISDIVFKSEDNQSFVIKTYSNSSLSDLSSFLYNSSSSYFFNDFNADGKTDICEIDEIQKKIIYFSYGSGFYEPSEQDVSLISIPTSVVDMNNDMIPDFVFINGNGLEIQVTIYYGSPDGIRLNQQFYLGSFLDYEYNEITSIAFADFSGNGANDVGVQTFKDGPQAVPGVLNASVIWDFGNSNNNISQFTNGLGKITNVEYMPFRSSYENMSSLNYPLGNYKNSKYLVQSFWVNNDLNKHNYSYQSPVFHREGKGFLGYMETTDHTVATNTNLRTTNLILKPDNLYYFLYPSEISLSFNTKVLRKTENQLSILNTEPDFPIIFKPYISQTITKLWENDDNSTFIKTTKNRIDDIDYYGNVLSQTTLQDENELELTSPDNEFDFKTIVTSEYEDPPGGFAWLTNRVKSKLVSKNNPDNVNDVDIGFYQYDYYTDNPWQILSVEYTPNNDNSFSIRETYNEYDDYGHLIEKTSEAVNPTPPYDDLPVIKTFFEYDNISQSYFHRFLTRTYQKVDGVFKKETEINYEYDVITGNVIKKTDPLGNVVHYKYDIFGRLEQVIFPDDNFITKVARWSETHPDNPDEGIIYTWEKRTGSAPSEIFYDNLGRKRRTITFGFEETKTIFKDYEYNDNGLLSREYDPYFSSNNADAYTEYDYDDLFRTKSISYFDNDGVILLRSKHFEYAGREATIISNQSMATETINMQIKNALGQTISSEDMTSVITYSYFASNKVKTIKVKSNDDNSEVITSMLYDKAGNQIQINEPNSGISAFTYDAYGRLRFMEDSKNNTVSYFYDDLNRIVDKNTVQGNNAFGGDIEIHYQYYTDPEQDGFGQLQYMINNSNGIRNDYYYDKYGRLIAQTEKIDDDHIFEKELTYDIYGRVKTQTYPTGYQTTNYYKPTGYFGKIRETSSNKTLWETTDVNQFGQITELSLGNELTSSYQYDNYGFLESIETGNGNIQQLEFDFDPSTGNLMSRDDNTNGKSLHEQFGYDSKLHNRLTSWEIGSQGNEYSSSYYDNGNIKSKTNLSSTSSTYQYNSSRPHAVTDVTNINPDYENLINNGVQQVFYNAFQKTHSIIIENNNKVEFSYGPDGLRKIMRSFDWNDNNNDWILSKTKYYILSNLEIEEFVNGDSRQLLYVGGFAIQEKINNNDPELFYVHTDYLGSVHAISNEDGTLKQFLSFDPWGRRRDADDWSYDIDDADPYFNRGFTGHEHLDEFGLINMNGRMYDPWVGRFLSPDPIVQTGNSQNYNRYSYVLNNPLKYTDPSGYLLSPAQREFVKSGGPQFNYDYLASYNRLQRDFDPGAPFLVYIIIMNIQAIIQIQMGEKFLIRRFLTILLCLMPFFCQPTQVFHQSNLVHIMENQVYGFQQLLGAH